MDAESCGESESPPFAASPAADTCILDDHKIDLQINNPDDDDHILIDDDEGADALPFALSHDISMPDSFLQANEALGQSLAATTISDSSSEAFLTPRSHQPPVAMRDPARLSSGSRDRDGEFDASASAPRHPPGENYRGTTMAEPSPNCISQPDGSVVRKQQRHVHLHDDDDRPSPAAAAAAEAAAALLHRSVPPPSVAVPSPSSSFILQTPPLKDRDGSCGDDVHDGVRCPILLPRRVNSPCDREHDSDEPSNNGEISGSGMTTTTASDPGETSLLPAPRFVSSGDTDPSDAAGSYAYQSTTSLGFSDLMRKAEGGAAAAGADSFALVSSPLCPVLEEAFSKEEESKEDEYEDRISLTSTPPMSNVAVGVGGETIVPPVPSPTPTLPFDAQPRLNALASSVPTPRPLRRRSPYRSMGPSVCTTQLSKDSFSISTHIDAPCSVRDVVNVLANPDLLRLWCVPVRSAIITSEGVGAGSSISSCARSSSDGGCGGGVGGREYDGEWVEITTPQLVSPSSSCTSCLYRGLTTTKAALGFQAEGYVKMFVERNRGQVGLSVGPFMGGMVADHTITVGDNCALLAECSEQHSGGDSGATPAAQSNGGVVITDTVRVRKDEDLVAIDGGYSCGLFGALERYVLPSISGYMTQAALSLENLCDIVCDGEACALAGTCSVDFSEDRGLGDDGCDGRTPLLS